jgi:GT2 family glycosyltransferase
MQKIPVVVINFNGKKTILETIKSIYEMENVEVSIHIIDDGSTDGSPELVVEHFPEIPIHRMPQNIARLNVLRNKALQLVKSERILLTDNDILFDKRCLFELVETMDRDRAIATCTPRLMYWDEPNRVYSADILVHYIGAAIGETRGKIVATDEINPKPNSGGGILLIDRKKALEVGGFDEDYKMAWGDDGEFYQRLLLAGYECLHIPTAHAYHENKPFSKLREYRATGQVYNRWIFILTHYSLMTILLLIPAFAIYEILQFFFMLLKKMPLLYFKGNYMVLKDLRLIFQKRTLIQKLRVVSDKNVLYAGNMYIAPSLLAGNAALRFLSNIVSGFFNAYWKLVKPLIP